MVENTSNQFEILRNLKVGDLTPLYSEASLKLQIDVVLKAYIAEVEKIEKVREL